MRTARFICSTGESWTNPGPLPTSPMLHDVRYALRSFAHSQNASLGRGVDARRVAVVLATASYFPLLGVRPALGRFYLADEDRLGGPAVAVLGYEFWKGAFGGDSGILGRRLQLGRGTYEVIGVAPERFTGEIGRAHV